MYFRFYGRRHIAHDGTHEAYRSIPLQRVTSLHHRAQDNAPTASYWLRCVLNDGGQHRERGAGCWGRSLQCTIALLSVVFSCKIFFKIVRAISAFPSVQLGLYDANGEVQLCQSVRSSVGGPVAWNSLPLALRSSDVTEETFRRHLKTFLSNYLDN